MSEQYWLIENGDGSYRQIATDGRAPSACGESGTAHSMVRRGDLTHEIANIEAGTWSDNMETIRARLTIKIESERQINQDALLSRGEGKMLVYTQKKFEKETYFSESPLEANATNFPAAYAEMEATSDTLEVVMQRFKAGIEAVNSRLYKLDALAQKAKTDLKAATTADEAEIAATVNW